MDIRSEKMKLLQTNQMNLLIFGCGVHEKQFNKRNVLSFFCFSFCVLSSGAYFFCEAKTFDEYAQSVFTTTAVMNFTLMFVLFVWNMRQFFDSVNEAEAIIDGS